MSRRLSSIPRSGDGDGACASGHSVFSWTRRQLNGPMNVAGELFPQGHEGFPGATINDGDNQLANRVDAAIAAADQTWYPAIEAVLPD